MPDGSAQRAPQNPQGHPKSVPRACLTASQKPSWAVLAGFKCHIHKCNTIDTIWSILQVLAIPPTRCCRILRANRYFEGPPTSTLAILAEGCCTHHDSVVFSSRRLPTSFGRLLGFLGESFLNTQITSRTPQRERREPSGVCVSRPPTSYAIF